MSGHDRNSLAHPSLAAETLPGTAPYEPSGLAETRAETVDPKVWHEFVDLYTLLARVRGDDLSVLILDINSLKATNDELGHDAGHQLVGIIDRVADELPKQFRKGDDESGRPADVVTSHSYGTPGAELPNGVRLPDPLSARVGRGDEFGVILPGTNEAGARALADRLVGTVNEDLQREENRPLAKVGAGVAAGVATLRPGMSGADLLREADSDMYGNKLGQMRPLSHGEEEEFISAIKHLRNANVRPRDVPKYLQMLGASVIVRAMEEQTNPDQLTFDVEKSAQPDHPAGQAG